MRKKTRIFVCIFVRMKTTGNNGSLSGVRKGLLLAACFAAGLFLQEPAFAQKHSVRLMTYNVGAFGKELDDSAPMIARMIAELGAEVVGLNELDSCNRRHDINQVQHLCDELNALPGMGRRKASWQGRFGRAMAYAGGAYGCGIVSRARIRHHFNIALPQGEGSEPRVCVVVETPRYVYAACHLDHIDEAARLEQARVLTAELQRRYGKGRKPVFLAGDFNDTPDSALLRQLSRDWTLLSPLEYSYSAKQPHVCIDYIFVLHGGPKVSVSASGVPTSFAYGDVETASDHLPLFVDVVF